MANYLDSGIDDESDVISTDRQELDWEKQELSDLRTWGEQLARRVLRECAKLRGKQLEIWILADTEIKGNAYAFTSAKVIGFAKIQVVSKRKVICFSHLRRLKR